MQWLIGSGLGKMLLSLIQNPSFQQSAISVVQSIGQTVLENLHDPAKLKVLGRNLTQNPQTVVGVMVKNTEVEKHVDAATVEAAGAVK
jgi:hypothetical protein